MIYQGPYVGSSKGNCCDRTQDIKSFEVEFYRPSTMSSHKKLKGFKKEREHFTRLRSTILKEQQQNHLSLRRDDRNKKKSFNFFFLLAWASAAGHYFQLWLQSFSDLLSCSRFGTDSLFTSPLRLPTAGSWLKGIWVTGSRILPVTVSLPTLDCLWKLSSLKPAQ